MFLALFFAAGFSQAATSPSLEREIARRHVNDGVRDYLLVESFNAHGTYEVKVFLEEVHFWRLVPSSFRLLLTGRAINVPSALIDENDRDEIFNPRKITTWFAHSSLQISRPLEYIQTTKDPWPTAKTVIQTIMDKDSRWLAWVAIESILPEISLAAGYHRDFFVQIKAEQMELYDLEIRIKHLKTMDPTNPVIPQGERVLANGWADIVQRMNNDRLRDLFLNAAGDVAIYVVGGKLISAGFKAVGHGANALSNSQVGQLVSSGYQTLSRQLSTKAGQVAGQVGSRAVVATTVAFSRLGVQQKVLATVSYLHTRSVLGRIAVQSVRNVALTAVGGAKQMKYVGMALSLQLFAETLARPEDLFDPNPLVLLNKITSDSDLMQNVAYMTNETFWMAGVSTHFASSSVKKRMVICGAIALVNSIGMSVLIKQEADVQRIALDTSWEMLVGNMQTQMDVAALTYFEGLSARKQMPHLRLAGYAVAMVDQGVGYFGYAKVTNLFEESRGGAQTPTPVEEMLRDPKFVLIPIMAPAS